MNVRFHRLSYYFETAASFALDPSGLVEKDGLWSGELATKLGLSGSIVDQATLEQIAGGEGGDRSARVRNAAYDCTFAAPKSVSVLFGLSDEEVAVEVSTAHEAAVSGAMEYLEHHAAVIRHRRHGRDEVVATEGFAEAAFLHRTSRALDPHLHSHVVVANRSCDKYGQWSAIDARQMYAHIASTGAYYRALLRHELDRRLGLSFRFNGGSFADLIGIDRRALLSFSQRKAAIDGQLDAYGLDAPSRALRDAVANSTRPSRELSRPYHELVAQWRDRALCLGLSMGHLSFLATRNKLEHAGDPVGTERAVHAALEGLDGPFSAEQLFRHACDHLAPSQLPKHLEEAVRSVISDPTRVAPTTRRARSHSKVLRTTREPSFETLSSKNARAALDALFLGGRNLGEALEAVLGGESDRCVVRGDLAVKSDQDQLETLIRGAKSRGLGVQGLLSQPFGHESLHLLFDLEPLSNIRGRRPGSILIIDDRTSSAPIARADAAADTLARGGAVVVLRSSKSASQCEPELRGRSVPGEGDARAFEALDGQKVLLASDIATLVRAIGDSTGAARSPQLVCADVDLAWRFDLPVIDRAKARELLFGNAPGPLFVLGGALHWPKAHRLATEIVHVGVVHALFDVTEKEVAARFFNAARDGHRRNNERGLVEIKSRRDDRDQTFRRARHVARRTDEIAYERAQELVR